MLIRTQANSWQPGVAVDLQAAVTSTGFSYHDPGWRCRQPAGDRLYPPGIRWLPCSNANAQGCDQLGRAASAPVHGRRCTVFSYSDFYYQTPGGLTRAQYLADAKQARPATATQPGAVQNRAAVFQKVFWPVSVTRSESAMPGNRRRPYMVRIPISSIRESGSMNTARNLTWFTQCVGLPEKFAASQLQFHAGIEAQKGF